MCECGCRAYPQGEREAIRVPTKTMSKCNKVVGQYRGDASGGGGVARFRLLLVTVMSRGQQETPLAKPSLGPLLLLPVRSVGR
jgi:hypothetical protein